MENVLFWIGLILAIQEPILRLIPNKKITGLFGVIFNLLKNASDYLNRERSYW